MSRGFTTNLPSKINRWGWRYIAAARQRRHFWPPDMVCIFCVGNSSPPNPKLARYRRITPLCALPWSPGYRSSIVFIGQESGSNCSSWCWAKYSILALPLMETLPLPEDRAPTMILMRVDFPDHTTKCERNKRKCGHVWNGRERILTSSTMNLPHPFLPRRATRDFISIVRSTSFNKIVSAE